MGVSYLPVHTWITPKDSDSPLPPPSPHLNPHPNPSDAHSDPGGRGREGHNLSSPLEIQRQSPIDNTPEPILTATLGALSPPLEI